MTIVNEDSGVYTDCVNLDVIVRSILISRAKEGATIEDIRDDYYSHVGEQFPCDGDILNTLLNIPNVTCTKDQFGTLIFNILQSEKSQHILNMVRNQKSQPQRNRVRQMQSDISVDSCYFQDNYQYLFSSRYRNNRGWPKRTSSINNCDTSAYLHDYQLMGDDFFLTLARMELKCRFAPGHKILQSGLCVSGQTISDAIKRIQTADFLSSHVIVNIGSVDILHGRNFIDIKHDFQGLIDAFYSRNVTPIITTLAPLANYSHRPQLKRTLERFNEFLIQNWNVIDLWPCMVNQYGQTLYECYQCEARYVSGSNQPHVFWNKIGRQRILQCLKRLLP